MTKIATLRIYERIVSTTDSDIMIERRTDQDGYLLVEVIVALFVIVILVSVGAMILNISNGARSRAENYGEANALAFAKMQEYALLDFGAIPSGNPGSSYEIEDFSSDIEARSDNKFKNVDAKVYSMAESGSLKKVWLSLYYEFGSSGSTIEYSTYIQIDGVGR